MSNLIQMHPVEARDRAPRNARRSTGATMLAEAAPHTHAVQFYDDEEFLFNAVGEYLSAGLRSGDRMVVIATDAHRDGFVARLANHGVDVAIESGQLVLLDARETLAKFMVGGMPDPDLFRDVLARTMVRVRGGAGADARVRAFGEMVDLLWREGNSKAAIRLEELWNDAGNEHSFSLLCAYIMGNFFKEGDTARFLEVCRNHSHVIPTESFSELDDADARLREISILQQRARSLESEIHHRKELETALRDALHDRSRVEEELRACVKREQEARSRAEASDAFKEVFLGILGHDLRNPLNTVLTTARLMTMRGELPPESQKRIERVVSSGVRMQRMIEQLLDVTRARLASGIPVDASEKHDIVPIVTKIVEEIRVSHPTRAIELVTAGPCTACVDCDRFEQVVSNLVGNAVTHGDPAQSVRVSIVARNGVASFTVHNHGPAIEPAVLERLFDPFTPGAKHRGRSDGLGLGLYISRCIVEAHDGKIEVESTQETGTTFEVIIPRRP